MSKLGSEPSLRRLSSYTTHAALTPGTRRPSYLYDAALLFGWNSTNSNWQRVLQNAAGFPGQEEVMSLERQSGKYTAWVKPCSSQTSLLYSRNYLPEERPEGSFKEDSIRGDQSPRGPQPVKSFTQELNEQHQAIQVTRALRARTWAFHIPASRFFFPFFTNKTHVLSLTFYPTLHYKNFRAHKTSPKNDSPCSHHPAPPIPSSPPILLTLLPTYSPSLSTWKQVFKSQSLNSQLIFERTETFYNQSLRTTDFQDTDTGYKRRFDLEKISRHIPSLCLVKRTQYFLCTRQHKPN